MTRLRAIPTTVWTAVGALAFLASTGLAVVLGAGIHVWSGPASRVAEVATHVLRGAGTGIVHIPGAPHVVSPTQPNAPSTPRPAALPPAPTPPSVAVTPPAPVAPPTSSAQNPKPQRPSSSQTQQLSSRALVRAELHGVLSGLNRLRLVGDQAIVAADALQGPGRGHGNAHDLKAPHEHAAHGQGHQPHGHGHGHGEKAPKHERAHGHDHGKAHVHDHGHHSD